MAAVFWESFSHYAILCLILDIWTLVSDLDPEYFGSDWDQV